MTIDEGTNRIQNPLLLRNHHFFTVNDIGMLTMEEIILRRVMYGERETGRRLTGGHQMRYKDNLEIMIKHFNIAPTSVDVSAKERAKWEQLVSTSASILASAYDSADAARRARFHNPPFHGAHHCSEYERKFVSMLGLRAKLRAHQRRLAADDG